MAAPLSGRGLPLAAAWGVAFTAVVVAASALLRLGTALDAGGNAASVLPHGLESAARIAHRISASAVGILAAAASYLAWRSRPVPRRLWLPLVAIVALTVVLAAIGRYTPGYRFLGVTVANAALGVALACAFAALYAHARRAAGAAVAASALLVLLAVLAEIALGTAASAVRMHGGTAFEPLHVALGPVVAALAAWVGLKRRSWVAAIAVAQMALGVALAAMGAARGIPGQWLHAMLACVLAIALAALAARPRSA